MSLPKSTVSYDSIMGNSFKGLSKVYNKKGNAKQSLFYFQNVTKFIQNSFIYVSLGYKLMQVNQYNEAILNYEKALNMDSLNIFAYNNRALAYLELKQYDLCEKDLQKSISINPNNPFTYKHRGKLMIALNKHDEACNDFNKSLALGLEKRATGKGMREINSLVSEYCK